MTVPTAALKNGDAKQLAIAALSAAPMLEGVPLPQRTRLAENGNVHHYRAGAFIFLAGDASNDVCCVVDGRIQIESSREDGRTMLRAVLGPGQVFGELGVLAGMPRTGSALALDDCAVWSVSGRQFIEFLRDVPAASHALLRALALQVVEHEAVVEDLLFLDLKSRVAKRLLALVTSSWDDLPQDGVAVPWNITQNDLASLCGGSRENVNRVLSELTKRGLIGRNGHRYVLKDIAGLRRLARV
ncbi:MAG TPA: Crp/Fnr family transcriptional regulator [Mycobacteriales bacterium]|nr:Crp/Fnr family transcriptional regulator [Mycobacteriales bacterium]